MKRALILAAVLIPACSGGGDGPGSSALFADGFDRSGIGSGWTAAAGTGDLAIDPSQGAPPPALTMNVRRGGAAVTAETALAFAARPLTAVVDLEAVVAGEGSGGVEILDAAGDVLAAAERFANPGGDMTFRIRGAEIRAALPSSPSGLQRVRLNVDAQGNAAWSLGDTAMLVQPGFPEGPVSLRLFTRAESVLPGTPFPRLLFDNVLVTSP